MTVMFDIYFLLIFHFKIKTRVLKPERGMASSKIEYRRTKTNFERKKIKNKKVVIPQHFIQDETYIFCVYVELSSLLGIKTKKKVKN